LEEKLLLRNKKLQGEVCNSGGKKLCGRDIPEASD
jgi:hypothetical protein